VVLSWLMREQRLAYDEALSRVREVRFVEPNLGFEQQLRAWEQQLARERLPAAAQAWAEQATAALRGAAAACAAAPVQSEAAAKAVLGEVWRAWEASCGGEVDGRAASEVAELCHSKLLGFAARSGDYFAVYRMDEAALRRGEYSYGPVPLPTAVVPALSKASGECEWRAWSAGGGDGPLYTWRGSYDATRRPWYQHAARHGTGWIVYADPVFPDERMRSFVSPLMGSDGALAGVLLAGSFAA